MKKRYRYVIGDLQGCYGALTKLLKKINFNEDCDVIYLCGDVVARGENSLECLRIAKQLSQKGALYTVLGNHDISLIATWLGILPIKPKDKTEAIFEAKDCDELLNWLRNQPFALMPDDKTIITHAGIPHIWTSKEALEYANELHTKFSGDIDELKRVLPKLYNKNAKVWGSLTGDDRLCAISDYLTRMRLINQAGLLEFGFKEGLDEILPDGFMAWFDIPVVRDEKVLFGHWAALEGKIRLPYAYALDGGAVWGGRLIAYRLEDGREFFVENECQR